MLTDTSNGRSKPVPMRMPTRCAPSMVVGVIEVSTILPSLPPRRTLNSIGSPFSAAVTAFATSSPDLIGMPPTSSSTSRTLSLPAAGVPSVTATTSMTGVTSYPSSRSAAAAALSWEVTISTWPSSRFSSWSRSGS